MADRAVPFDELVATQALRDRSYVVLEPPATGLACVDLSARAGPDWFFARRWIPVREGRRQLYRTLDRIEAAGFRFRVRPAPRILAQPNGGALDPAEGPWLRASRFVAGLEPEERVVYRELFPEEAGLLEAGYDWDGEGVWVRKKRLAPDAFGRILEATEEWLYEWVRVEDESTWRRYPLQALTRWATGSPRGT